MEMITLIFGTVGAIICGVVASNKNRNTVGWVIFGLCIPLIAIIAVLCVKRKISWSDNPEFEDLPCPHCNIKITGSSIFCPKCGKQLKSD